jgi:uncharacterized protein
MIENHFKTLVLAAFLISVTVAGCVRTSPPPKQPGVASPAPVKNVTPARVGSINDYANIFGPSEKERLEFTINELMTNYDLEFVLVTVKTTNPQSIFDYSLGLARDWKVGSNGRGLVFVLAIEDRNWRLQTSRVLERDLPDDVCKKLAEPAVELFKEGKYALGIDAYLHAIGDRLHSQQPAG